MSENFNVSKTFQLSIKVIFKVVSHRATAVGRVGDDAKLQNNRQMFCVLGGWTQQPASCGAVLKITAYFVHNLQNCIPGHAHYFVKNLRPRFVPTLAATLTITFYLLEFTFETKKGRLGPVRLVSQETSKVGFKTILVLLKRAGDAHNKNLTASRHFDEYFMRTFVVLFCFLNMFKATRLRSFATHARKLRTANATGLSEDFLMNANDR